MLIETPCTIHSTHKQQFDNGFAYSAMIETPFFRDWATVAEQHFPDLPPRHTEFVGTLDVYYKNGKRKVKLVAVK